MWLENIKAMWPADEEITWSKFKDQFRKYHIPTGIMKTKDCEFLTLLQGNQSVGEYLQKFNHLACYSLHDVATKERKIDRFLGGLNSQLRCTLSMFDFPGVGAGGAVDVDVSMRELWLAFGGWTIEARAWQLRSRPPRARVTLF